jgi:ribA/ribD-fused uncharacterized protein
MAQTYTFFWKPSETNGEFSQWHMSEFTDAEGIIYKCAEQYMMYWKAKLFDDEKIAKKILDTTDPKEIKLLGRKIKNFDESTWVANREDIVYDGNYYKFTQDKKLKKKLLKCSNFVEASPYDKIWGIGYVKSQALANKSTWGLNLLGKALDKVKEVLKENE